MLSKVAQSIPKSVHAVSQHSEPYADQSNSQSSHASVPPPVVEPQPTPEVEPVAEPEINESLSDPF